MSDLISREEVIKIVDDAMQWKNRRVTDRISFFGPRTMTDTVSDILALPAAPADAIKARALLSPWLETPNEGDPMIDVLLGVIREAHAALGGGEA